MINCPDDLANINPEQITVCVFVESDDTRLIKILLESAIVTDGHRFDEPPPFNYWMDREGYLARILEFLPTGDYILVHIHPGTADQAGQPVATGSTVAFIW